MLLIHDNTTLPVNYGFSPVMISKKKKTVVIFSLHMTSVHLVKLTPSFVNLFIIIDEGMNNVTKTPKKIII